MTFDSLLYEELCAQYAWLDKLITEIYLLKEEQADELFEKIVNVVESKKLDINSIIRMIVQASNYNARALRSYYSLFLKLHDKFKFKFFGPNFDLSPRFQALVKKTFNLVAMIQEEYIPKTIDEILNIYRNNSVMHSCLYDNIEVFKGHYAKGTFNENLFYKNQFILEWCSQYGSVKCFKFLLEKGAQITRNCLIKSFMGRNDEIIHLCLSKFSPGTDCNITASISHNLDYGKLLYDQYHIPFDYYQICYYRNFQLFVYSLCKEHNYNQCFPKVLM